MSKANREEGEEEERGRERERGRGRCTCHCFGLLVREPARADLGNAADDDGGGGAYKHAGQKDDDVVALVSAPPPQPCANDVCGDPKTGGEVVVGVEVAGSRDGKGQDGEEGRAVDEVDFLGGAVEVSF